MYARVVRFEDLDIERVNARLEHLDEDGPPEGVPVKGLQIMVDEEQGTAVVMQLFDSKEDMLEGDKVFGAMDASDTPGRRVSVDRCEIKAERSA